VDRPGLGGSDPQPRRRLLDWPDDVLFLAGQLGIDRFAVLGWSGGGPYALACAHAAPERVSAVGLVGSLAPIDAPGAMSAGKRRVIELVRGVPAAAELQLRAIAQIARRPWLAEAAVRAWFTGPDREAVSRPEIARRVVAFLEASLRGGPAGPREDLALLTGDWGFSLEALACPVVLHHGEADRNAPPEMGRALARVIPDCRATFHPGEGHVSLIARRAGPILEEVAAAARAGSG
jgi:pimeloyl-ACP methyl ester carboxylesterase